MAFKKEVSVNLLSTGVRLNVSGTVWATEQGNATADALSKTSFYAVGRNTGSSVSIYRTAIEADISSIRANYKILSASLIFTIPRANTLDTSIHVQESTIASMASVGVADFDSFTGGSLGSVNVYEADSIGTSYTILLNYSFGSDTVKFFLREAHDINNSDPSPNTYDTQFSTSMTLSFIVDSFKPPLFVVA